MNLAELLGFWKEGKPTSKSHMKNLLEMAMVDSHLDDTEFDLLKKLAKKHKVSEKELNEIQADPDKIEFELPEDDNEKFEQFYELVNMMTVDERVFEEEKNLCRIFAKKFGYTKPWDLVDAVEQNIQNGQSPKETMKRVKPLM